MRHSAHPGEQIVQSCAVPVAGQHGKILEFDARPCAVIVCRITGGLRQRRIQFSIELGIELSWSDRSTTESDSNRTHRVNADSEPFDNELVQLGSFGSSDRHRPLDNPVGYGGDELVRPIGSE
ncbi:hypothetical protein [Kribbella sp. NPDC048928]|uniref:hypothetical protein n=1 Tax=Kribbella sp. NPDC048928 TaxID=3364111 RepID=UPI003723712F